MGGGILRGGRKKGPGEGMWALASGRRWNVGSAGGEAAGRLEIPFLQLAGGMVGGAGGKSHI
jgi:hypothetical protein